MASRTSNTNPPEPVARTTTGVLTPVRHVRRRFTRSRSRPAFSVIEALMASVVLAIAVVGVAGPLAASGEQAQMVRERGAALTLARQLLEEIASKPLCDGGTTCRLGPETSTGETSRDKFDSADDYHGYTDKTDHLSTLAGQTVFFAAGKAYTRAVTVEYRATLAGNATTSGDFGLVTVNVTTPQNQTITISRLFTKHSVSY